MSGGSLLRLVAALALCLGVGFASGKVTAPEIGTWYATLVKPPGTPPNWVFPVVWSALYALMGLSLWLLWARTPDGSSHRRALMLFFLQLVFNAAWSMVFFGLHQVAAAFVVIVAMIAGVAATIALAWRINRAASLCLVPYLAWIAYAAYLNAGIWMLN
jgi:tryptophan-rich sensory protein